MPALPGVCLAPILLAFLGLLGWLRGRLRPAAAVSLLAAAAFVPGLVVYARCLANESLFNWPQPLEDRISVEFVGENLDWTIPTMDYANEPARNYHLASEWTLRLGYFFDIRTTPMDLKLTSDLVVLGGREEVSADTVHRLTAYVEGGGRVLFCLGRHGGGAWTAFLEQCGMRLGSGESSVAEIQDAGQRHIWKVRAAREVDGGTPLLLTKDGAAVTAYVELGRGQVTVCAAAEAFLDVSMGLNDAREPDEELRHHFSLWYALLSGSATGAWEQEFESLR